MLTNCSEKRRVSNGTYLAFFYETMWTLEIDDDKFTYLSSGHLGTERPVSGEYKISGDTLILLTDSLDYHNKFLIDGDSCLIEVEMQTDYCNKRPDEWDSRWRDINYPQIEVTDTITKERVHWMLETALNGKEILEYFPDTTKSIVIQEYYELNNLADIALKARGVRVTFLPEDEIKRRGINEYLTINDVRLGKMTAKVDFAINHAFPRSLLEFFEKRNGKWTHLKY